MLTLRARVKDSLAFKLLQSFRRFLSGLGQHLLDTTRDFAVVVAEHRRDRGLGIRTNLPWRRNADESGFRDMQPYDPISYAAADKILAFLALGPEDVFIDLGCGQGRAVFLAATLRPKRAVGVELNEDLFRIAMENKRTFRGGGGEFVRADAASFDVSEGTAFFFSDPFGPKTFGAVVENIRRSLIAKPRIIRVAYFCARQRSIFDSQPWLELDAELQELDTLVWRSR
ncbi:MAG: class I SAM-dependent methyltransferase [Elusimicrobia bacterium]|nr:class I SAM-dependent methyltransferase [Elusimicrobiota bacterium]